MVLLSRVPKSDREIVRERESEWMIKLLVYFPWQLSGFKGLQTYSVLMCTHMYSPCWNSCSQRKWKCSNVRAPRLLDCFWNLILVPVGGIWWACYATGFEMLSGNLQICPSKIPKNHHPIEGQLVGSQFVSSDTLPGWFRLNSAESVLESCWNVESPCRYLVKVWYS